MKRNFFDQLYQRYYKPQPKWAKGVINVLVVGGGAYLLWQWHQSSKEKKILDEAGQTADYATQELAALAKQGIVPSFSNSEYEALSQGLEQAMSGCGTDEDLIYQIFGYLKNKADVLKLITVFNIRYYMPCKWTNPQDYLLWQINPQRFPGGLSAWLRFDLTTNEIAKVNQIMAERGITYQF